MKQPITFELKVAILVMGSKKQAITPKYVNCFGTTSSSPRPSCCHPFHILDPVEIEGLELFSIETLCQVRVVDS